MGFKMKGPGLPGFRKQQGSGFYKSCEIPMTNNRSPMKQGEDKSEEMKKQFQSMTEDEVARARKNWIRMKENGEDVEDWTVVFSDTTKKAEDNKTVVTNQSAEMGIIKGDEPTDIVKPGDPGYNKWLEAVTKDPSREDRFKDRFVLKENREVEIFKPKKDIEYTNFRLSYNTTAGPGKAGAIDKNDHTARFDLAGVDGINMTGQLSKNDIEKLVKDGKLKYEEGASGTSGNLLMSKDFYDNTYMPQQTMYEEGQANLNEFHANADAYRIGRTKHVKNMLQEEGLKRGKKYEERKKELNREYIQRGKEMNYYTPNGGRPSHIPGWMYNDPNYGQVQPGIYNDDETTHGTASPDQLISGDERNNTRGGRWDQNLQGDRGLDWEKDPKTGKYVLKEDAKTLSAEDYAKLDNSERREHIMSTEINGKGVVFGPSKGHRDENGTWIPGTGVEDRATRWDHLLTNQEGLESSRKMRSDPHNRNRLEATEDQISKGGADSEKDNVKVETNETNLGYSDEDQAEINKI